MTDSAPTHDDLTARVAALEVENARLRDDMPSAGARAGSGRWRAWVSALCIIIAAVLVPISIVTAWTRVQLVDEDAFVQTLAPLASDPAVQSMVIDQTMDAITAQVDFAGLTSNVIDGVASLGLPPAAARALGLLKQPAADGLESLVERGVTRVVTSGAFADVWTTTTRAAHRALTTAATSDGGGLVVRTADGVGIQLGAIVDRVKQNLVEQGVGIANLIPAIDRVIIVGTGENLTLVRGGYALAAAVGYWLPLVSLALFIAGILIARRRSVALQGAGIGLLLGGGSLALGLSIGAAAMSTVATQIGVSPRALEAIYHQFSDEIAHVSAIIAIIGVVVLALAWVNGRTRPAIALRAGVASVNVGLRASLATRGVDTGRFGRWMFGQRALVRVIVAALAIIWLLALRPLTAREIILVLVVGLLAWWIAELVQKRPGEVAEVAPDAAAHRAEDAALAVEEAVDEAVDEHVTDDLVTEDLADTAELIPADAMVTEQIEPIAAAAPSFAAPPAKKPRGGAAKKS